ncbi:MAG TPA: OmpA family protein [Saprospiraceae bacterium]|nr:OmpA family protein [Saprospiraceae bacterium]
MKKLLFLLSFLSVSTSIFAQELDHDRYKISGGLLAAYNADKFRIEGDNTFNIEYDYSAGWSAGIWLNFPLGYHFSLEPEVMYSYYDYDAQRIGAPFLITDGGINYIQVPVLLKWHWGKNFAISAGPEFDLVAGLDATPASTTEDSITSSSIALNAGFELWPHNTISLYGRYIHGFTIMQNTVVDNGNADYYNSNFQFGIKFKLFGKVIPADTDKDSIADKDDQCPTVAGVARYAGCPIPDTDGDGVNDEMDNCVSVVGLERYAGCPIPDTDVDGMNDEVDKCPKVAGLAKYNGCPIPDTDTDGINDEQDKCPTVAGLAKYNGCPVPDTDSDGVNDEQDKCPSVAGTAKMMGCPDKDNDGVTDAEDHCPTVAGPVDNFGCPKIESAKFTTQRIQFVTGSSKLTADAKANIKEGAKLLNSNDFKMLKIEIRGHTDNTGSSESNHTLSHKRAEAVLEELAKNGVSRDRMTAKGFGEDMPIADNNTKEGRAQNRRVVFDVKE